MNLNDDFTQRAAVHGAKTDWFASPMPGVDRKPLDRIGDEVARATTIVRYAPGSSFSAHTHTGGEEFLVLEGVFQDQYGDFPAGTYVRNPPTTSHEPASEEGCVILVKLWQFDMDDRNQFHVAGENRCYEPVADGVEAARVHKDDREEVRFERWAPGARVVSGPHDGLEIFVLKGGFAEGGEDFAVWSWLRLPKGAALTAAAGPEGAEVWIKEGHLATTPSGPAV
ncbi:MAG: cupin domain-containing protein [Pseudomonadota bacterium]